MTLGPPACDDGYALYLQVRLATDEILLGTLLLERGGDHMESALEAINDGAYALAELRFTLSDAIQPADGPTAAPTPFGDLSADAVLAAFEAADLPLADVTRDAAAAPGDAPHTEAERITFTLPDIFDGGTGQLLIFDDWSSLETWASYLYALPQATQGYVYLHRNTILQLDAGLDEDTVRAFRQTLFLLE